MTPIQQALAHFKDSHNEWTASQITDYLKSLLLKEKEFVGNIWDAALTRTWAEYRSKTDGVPDKQQFINQLYPKP